MVESDIARIGRLGRPRYLVLGMDPGVASCGFALLDMNNCEILEMGARLFDPPVHPKTGQSLAAIRRGFRDSPKHRSDAGPPQALPRSFQEARRRAGRCRQGIPPHR